MSFSDNVIRRMSSTIYSYVTKYLPYSYRDTLNDSTIDVLKTATGLQVITTKVVDDGGYREITVNIPEAEIERLLNQG